VESIAELVAGLTTVPVDIGREGMDVTSDAVVPGLLAD
jgi:hypothetical protein